MTIGKINPFLVSTGIENQGSGRWLLSNGAGFDFSWSQWQSLHHSRAGQSALPPIARSDLSIQTDSAIQDNPLLQWVYSAQPGLNINYAAFRPEDVAAAADALLAKLEQDLTDYETALQTLGASATWQHVHNSYAAIFRPVERFYGLVELLELTQGNKWGATSAAARIKLDAFKAKLAQSQIVYNAFRRFEDLDATPEQLRAIRAVVTKALAQGTHFDAATKARFDALTAELTIDIQQFKDNISASQAEAGIVLTERVEVAGIPDATLKLLAKAYAEKHHKLRANPDKGPWLIPASQFKNCWNWASYPPTQKKILQARLNIGAMAGHDNATVAPSLTNVRHEIASLSGYANFAAYAWSDDLVTSKAELDQFITPLWGPLTEASAAIYARIAAYAESQDGQFSAASEAYWTLQWQKSLGFNVEDIEKKLDLKSCLDSLFANLEATFNLDIVQQPASPEGLPDGVIRCDVYRDGVLLSQMDLDLRYRNDKAKFAFNYTIVASEVLPDGTAVLPYGYVSANFARVNDAGELTLSLFELNTLCHEMGHVLQGALYDCDSLLTSGTYGLEEDAGEIGSMFSGLFLNDMVLRDRLADAPDLLAGYEANRALDNCLTFGRQIAMARFDAEIYADPTINTHTEMAELFDRLMGAAKPFVLTDGNTEDLRAFPHPFSGAQPGAYNAYLRSQAVALNYLAFVQGMRDAGKSQREVGTAIAKLYEMGAAADPRQVYRDITGQEDFDDPTAFAAWLGISLPLAN